MTRQKSNHASIPEWEPLEDNLKHLDPPELPTSWKADIIHLARQQQNASATQTNHIRIQKNKATDWLVRTTCLIRSACSRLTPVQVSMVLIWSFIFIGGRLDSWLNAPLESHAPRYFHLGLTASFSAQIESWELAGLNLPQSFDEKENKPSETDQNKPSTQDPRSSLETDNTTHLRPLAIGRLSQIPLVAFIPSKQISLEAPSSFKRSLPQLPARRGSGTIRPVINPQTSTI